MKISLKMWLPSFLLVACVGLSAVSQAEVKRALPSDVAQTYADITKTLGFIPGFMKAYPEKALVGAWSEFKAVQLSQNSAIPCRYKELIGLAVASQIPCHYCTYFHTSAARAQGATQDEISEAIALAGAARHWSTFLNGTQEEQGRFDYTLRMLSKRSKELAEHPRPETEKMLNGVALTRDQAFDEMKFILGSVPNFMRNFPEQGVAGAWNNVKTLLLNPQTSAIPLKYKSLIGLAVSAQIPCQYCVQWDTQGSEMVGASATEINEAVAMAAIARQWSTVLNGSQIDMAQFKSEMAQIFGKKSETRTQLRKKDKAVKGHS